MNISEQNRLLICMVPMLASSLVTGYFFTDADYAVNVLWVGSGTFAFVIELGFDALRSILGLLIQHETS